ncbi:hypothetical protein ACX3T3_03870 [Actinotignum schaalii]|uniref:hypothetical protein n=1 Tax=Actinotignum TaxID=1653174 RepID=UPI00237DFCBA|nr:hypothetical protein [Actinotignum sanguinis]MDE1552248.1 hypothetical protein [Actinotignum sanguinis]MDE1643187.1 hypothetical protein [Actinotignum sanguinis]
MEPTHKLSPSSLPQIVYQAEAQAAGLNHFARAMTEAYETSRHSRGEETGFLEYANRCAGNIQALAQDLYATARTASGVLWDARNEALEAELADAEAAGEE